MKPRIGIFSIFRDDAGANIAAYRRRINSLDYPPELLRLYLAEGDSIDDTYNELIDWENEDERVNVAKADSGLPRHGHTTDPERFTALAKATNAAIDLLDYDSWADLVVLIESDLIYDSDLLEKLVSHKPDGKSVIAPMIWLATQTSFRFYDIWAFRNFNGDHFPLEPIEWYLEHYPRIIFEIQSAGSVVMFDMEAIKSGCRYDSEVIAGMCKQARQLNYRIYCDPNISVLHPPEE
jgi:hypothetical protein